MSVLVLLGILYFDKIPKTHVSARKCLPPNTHTGRSLLGRNPELFHLVAVIVLRGALDYSLSLRLETADEDKKGQSVMTLHLSPPVTSTPCTEHSLTVDL